MFQLKQRVVVFVTLTLLFVGCMPATTEDSASSIKNIISEVPSSLKEDDSGGVLTFAMNDVVVSMQRPPTWESVATDYGVALTEELDSLTARDLNSVVAHIFVPPLDNVVLAEDSSGIARTILRQIIANPEYIDGATTTMPVAFRWQELDAAYFMMTNTNHVSSVVVGIIEPGVSTLVVIQVSAATEQATRIRALLPQIVDHMSINNVELSGDLLDGSLPSVLQFPDME